MTMTEWARREVKIACKREAPDRKEGEWDYGCACYESALKAYECLMEDGHSGMSWNITKNILMRLMDDKPLTPIEDTEDVWNDVTYGDKEKNSYQCKRMSSLFKDVYPDGRIEYHDVNRVSIIDIDVDNPNYSWHNGFISRLVNEKYPITMPYVPETKPYIAHCRELLTDRKNGDYDTLALLFIEKPDGSIDNDVCSYFKESEDGYVLISHDEYLARLDMHLKRIEREEVKYSDENME